MGIAPYGFKFDQSLSSTVRCSTVSVTGLIGHNVTLPCKYKTHTHGVPSFCWGRDAVPMSKCSKTILSSQNGIVQIRQSSRYQLLGGTAGDVSLTILNAQWSDVGVYGCRVEVPGWFNDYKFNTHLLMEEGNAHESCSGWLCLWCFSDAVLHCVFFPGPVEQLDSQVWTVSTGKRQINNTNSWSTYCKYLPEMLHCK